MSQHSTRDDALSRQLAAQLLALGVTPTRGKGQHYLIDRGVLDAILAVASLVKTDTVLEVGPGLGILTNELAQRAQRVIAVELERNVAAWLAARFARNQNVTIVDHDILSWNRSAAGLCDRKYVIVANIPYSITGKFLRDFLTQSPRPSAMTLLIQKEVAERLVAKPGQLSISGLAAQFYAKPEIIAFVKATAFYPAPKVQSAIVRLTDVGRNARAYPHLDDSALFKLIRIGFATPRKKLLSNLAHGLTQERSAILTVLASCGVGENARAQELSLEQWVALNGVLG